MAIERSSTKAATNAPRWSGNLTVVVELIALIGGLVTLGAATAGGFSWVAVRVVRRHAEIPGGPHVPVRWTAAPGAAARLHRRLARATRIADAVAPRARHRLRLRHQPPRSPLQELAAELRSTALDIDRHVVLASGLAAPARSIALRQLALEVDHVEQAAARVLALAAPGRGLSDGVPAPVNTAMELAERARLLSEATDELDRLVR